MFFPILRIVPLLGSICTCFVVSCVPGDTPIRAEPALRAYFVDVGQGDACLLRTPGGRWFLFDIGNDARALTAFLRHVRADTLEAAFISHPDLDHFGALPALLQGVPVKKVYLPNGASPSPAWQEALRALDVSSAEQETLLAGDTLAWEGDVHVRVLWPRPHSSMSDNDLSTVIRVEYAGKRIVLTGDIEDPAEEAIRKTGADLAADILKVAHHGSRTSSGLEFVAAVHPSWAVISCDSTVYGHPHAEAVADLRAVMGDSTRILRTDREGTLAFTLDGMGIRRFDPWTE